MVLKAIHEDKIRSPTQVITVKNTIGRIAAHPCVGSSGKHPLICPIIDTIAIRRKALTNELKTAIASRPKSLKSESCCILLCIKNSFVSIPIVTRESKVSPSYTSPPLRDTCRRTLYKTRLTKQTPVHTRYYIKVGRIIEVRCETEQVLLACHPFVII